MTVDWGEVRVTKTAAIEKMSCYFLVISRTAPADIHSVEKTADCALSRVMVITQQILAELKF